MFYTTFTALVLIFVKCTAQTVHESDINFRVEAGTRTCFFEKGKTGQTMEVYYEVLDGQHGDLDITFEIIDPNGVKLLTDYKKQQNSIIRDLTTDGDYVFCMDNTYSLMNSKLVFVYVVIEDKAANKTEADVSVVENGEEQKEVVEWAGVDEKGDPYYVEVKQIIDSLTRTLQNVVQARHLLGLYAASRSRDSYTAFEDTFIVDVWSAFQITFMATVGALQVYMIKKLFNKPSHAIDNYY